MAYGRKAHIDWSRLGSRGLIGLLLVLAGVQLVLQLRGNQYGYDFRAGTWAAGHVLLAGNSPYPAHATPAYLLAHPNSFITPPVLALLGAPFSLLSWSAAIMLFNLLCLFAVAGTLRVLEVQDRAFWLLVLCSFPFVASLALGQPDGVFILGAAAAWRWRESWPGAVAAGVIIAAKLLAWPLVIWLLITRRFRQAALTAAAAGGVLVVSWACVGFKGMLSYPSLLAADSTAFGDHSHSFLSALVRSGLAPHLATVLGALLAAVIATATVIAARRSDLGWFTAALSFGVLSSPVVWQHYLLLLFVPAAATRRWRDPVLWLLAIALWISPAESPATIAQAWAIPLIAAGISVRIGVLSRADGELAKRSAHKARKRRRSHIAPGHDDPDPLTGYRYRTGQQAG